MTAARGWCPSVFTPMAAPDGLLVRIKPRGARLPSGMARRIADAVALYGNGRIELTSRANLQVRGLTGAGSRMFAHAMVACGVADADPAIERRRNIVVSPLAGRDPSILGRPEKVAEALEAALAQTDLVLPDKFGFSVDGGGVLPLGPVSADITLRTGETGCRVEIAGAVCAVDCDAASAAALALDLARAFHRLGGRRRMRDLVATIGADVIYNAAGSRPSCRAGPFASACEVPCHFALAAPAGELTPARLASAADVADEAGDGCLRVTPWRSLLYAAAS